METDLSTRQLEIIEVSGKILMQKGILGLTTKNLAQEMKFSESALYRHFNKTMYQFELYRIRQLNNARRNIKAHEKNL